MNSRFSVCVDANNVAKIGFLKGNGVFVLSNRIAVGFYPEIFWKIVSSLYPYPNLEICDPPPELKKIPEKILSADYTDLWEFPPLPPEEAKLGIEVNEGLDKISVTIGANENEIDAEISVAIPLFQELRRRWIRSDPKSNPSADAQDCRCRDIDLLGR